MQSSKVKKWKRIVKPLQDQKLDASDEKEQSPGMEEENQDRRVDVQKPIPQPEPAIYVPKLPLSTKSTEA